LRFGHLVFNGTRTDEPLAFRRLRLARGPITALSQANRTIDVNYGGDNRGIVAGDTVTITGSPGDGANDGTYTVTAVAFVGSGSSARVRPRRRAALPGRNRLVCRPRRRDRPAHARRHPRRPRRSRKASQRLSRLHWRFEPAFPK